MHPITLRFSCAVAEESFRSAHFQKFFHVQSACFVFYIAIQVYRTVAWSGPMQVYAALWVVTDMLVLMFLLSASARSKGAHRTFDVMMAVNFAAPQLMHAAAALAFSWGGGRLAGVDAHSLSLGDLGLGAIDEWGKEWIGTQTPEQSVEMIHYDWILSVTVAHFHCRDAFVHISSLLLVLTCMACLGPPTSFAVEPKAGHVLISHMIGTEIFNHLTIQCLIRRAHLRTLVSTAEEAAEREDQRHSGVLCCAKISDGPLSALEPQSGAISPNSITEATPTVPCCPPSPPPSLLAPSSTVDATTYARTLHRLIALRTQRTFPRLPCTNPLTLCFTLADMEDRAGIEKFRAQFELVMISSGYMLLHCAAVTMRNNSDRNHYATTILVYSAAHVCWLSARYASRRAGDSLRWHQFYSYATLGIYLGVILGNSWLIFSPASQTPHEVGFTDDSSLLFELLCPGYTDIQNLQIFIGVILARERSQLAAGACLPLLAVNALVVVLSPVPLEVLLAMMTGEFCGFIVRWVHRSNFIEGEVKWLSQHLQRHKSPA